MEKRSGNWHSIVVNRLQGSGVRQRAGSGSVLGFRVQSFGFRVLWVFSPMSLECVRVEQILWRKVVDLGYGALGICCEI